MDQKSNYKNKAIPVPKEDTVKFFYNHIYDLKCRSNQRSINKFNYKSIKDFFMGEESIINNIKRQRTNWE